MKIRMLPALIAGLATLGAAAADASCFPDPPPDLKCAVAASYVTGLKNGCEKSLCNFEAPDSIEIECTDSGGGMYSCQVWPSAAAASFTWNSTGQLLVTPFDGGVASVQCTGDPGTGGVVQVTFTSPGGASVSSTTPVVCLEESTQ